MLMKKEDSHSFANSPTIVITILILWISPFIFYEVSWIIVIILIIMVLTVTNISQPDSFNFSERTELKSYFDLVSYLQPVYLWEEKNNPFIKNLPSFRFTKRISPKNIEDFQAIYIDPKESVLFTFNLIGQENPFSLYSFMIESINDVYLLIEVPFKKGGFSSHHKNITYKKTQYSGFLNIKIIFNLTNSHTKFLSAYLYPPKVNNSTYLINHQEASFYSVLNKGKEIISYINNLRSKIVRNKPIYTETQSIVRIKEVGLHESSV